MHVATTSRSTVIANHAFADLLRHWCGHQLSAVANLDSDFADYLAAQAEFELVGQPGSYSVFSDDSITAQEVVMRYIVACKPQRAPGSTMPDRELCEDAACQLLGLARDELGFTEDDLDTEFATFAAAFMGDETDFQVVSTLWQIVACRTDMVMTAELFSSIQADLLSPIVAEAIMMSLDAEGFDPDQITDVPTGHFITYQAVAADREAQRKNGHPALSVLDFGIDGEPPPSARELLASTRRIGDGSPIIGGGLN